MTTILRLACFLAFLALAAASSCTLTVSYNFPSATACTQSCTAYFSNYTNPSCSGVTCSASSSGLDCNNCNTACNLLIAFGANTCTCSSSSCFPGSATVTLRDGSSKRMDELQLGDEVMVSLTSSSAEYSAVYVFGHRLKEFQGPFVQLVTPGHNLTLTHDHLVYADGDLVSAGEVRIGQVLETAEGKKERVKEVRTVKEVGLYNPHTLHGDIFVNGVRASTYTNNLHPTLAHWLLAPLRGLYHAGIDLVGDRWNNGVLPLTKL